MSLQHTNQVEWTEPVSRLMISCCAIWILQKYYTWLTLFISFVRKLLSILDKYTSLSCFFGSGNSHGCVWVWWTTLALGHSNSKLFSRYFNKLTWTYSLLLTPWSRSYSLFNIYISKYTYSFSLPAWLPFVCSHRCDHECVACPNIDEPLQLS